VKRNMIEGGIIKRGEEFRDEEKADSRVKKPKAMWVIKRGSTKGIVKSCREGRRTCQSRLAIGVDRMGGFKGGRKRRKTIWEKKIGGTILHKGGPRHLSGRGNHTVQKMKGGKS